MSKKRRSITEKVLDNVDIVQVIESFLGSGKLKQTPTNCYVECPFHDERTASFCVVKRKQFFYCFGCGCSGNAIVFVMEYKNVSYLEALQQIAGFSGVKLRSGQTKPARARRRNRGVARSKKRFKNRQGDEKKRISSLRRLHRQHNESKRFRSPEEDNISF